MKTIWTCGLVLLASASGAMAMTMRPTMPAGGTTPQLVECAYGHPNCVNPDPGPKAPKVGGVKLPDDGWTDPDCQYYADLCTPEPAPWFGFPPGTFGPN